MSSTSSSSTERRKPMFHVHLPGLTAAQPAESSEVAVPDAGRVELQGRSVRATLDDFECGNLAGMGAHGKVYIVRHVPSGTVMAQKEFLLDSSTEAQLALVVKELKILRGLRGERSIVQFYGAVHKFPKVHVFMEHMDIGSLDEVLAAGRQRGEAGFPVAILQQVALHMVDALEALKRRNILHRDIKPGNMLANSAGQFKLCDFSVSKQLSTSGVLTYKGSCFYLAPELISSEPRAGSRSDVWSLGVAIYELAAGRNPFDDGTPMFAVLSRIVDGPSPVETDAFRQHVTDHGLADFLTACLIKSARKRPDSATLKELAFLKDTEISCEDVSRWLMDDLGMHRRVFES